MAGPAVEAGTERKTRMHPLKMLGLAVGSGLLLLLIVFVVLPTGGVHLLVLTALMLLMLWVPPYADQLGALLRAPRRDARARRRVRHVESYIDGLADGDEVARRGYRLRVNSAEAVRLVLFLMVIVGSVAALVLAFEVFTWLPEDTSEFGHHPYLWMILVPVLAATQVTRNQKQLWPPLIIMAVFLPVTWLLVQTYFGRKGYSFPFHLAPDAWPYFFTAVTLVPVVGMYLYLRHEVGKARRRHADAARKPGVDREAADLRLAEAEAAWAATWTMIAVVGLSIAVWWGEGLWRFRPFRGEVHTEENLGWVLIRQLGYLFVLRWMYQGLPAGLKRFAHNRLVRDGLLKPVAHAQYYHIRTRPRTRPQESTHDSSPEQHAA